MFGNQKGLTLIELMIIVVIIGIVAAFAASGFMGTSDRARVREALNLGACPECSDVVYVGGYRVVGGVPIYQKNPDGILVLNMLDIQIISAYGDTIPALGKFDTLLFEKTNGSEGYLLHYAVRNFSNGRQANVGIVGVPKKLLK